MIRLIDDSFDRLEEVRKICVKDPFGVRIYSYLTTYDLSLDFIDIWYQEDKKGKIVALISRFEDRYTIFSLYTRNRARLDELQEFVSFRSPASVMFDFKLRIDFEKPKSAVFGDVLKFRKSHATFKEKEIYKPGTVYYYSVLKKNESEDFKVPEYMYFLSDITYRKNREKVAMFGINHEESLASVCMTVSECDEAVILGAVATEPKYKRQGYCSRVVNAAASIFALNKRDVYIFSTKKENTKLYKKIGFKETSYFVEYIFR